MTETQKAYIAGIIDGEGSIMLIKIHKNTNPSPVISVTSTTLELLQYMKSIIGNGIISKKTNYNNLKHKDCFTYTLTYNKALDLLIEIEPYLIIKSKKERAHMLITKYKSLTPRNGRYSESLLLEKEKFYETFLQIK